MPCQCFHSSFGSENRGSTNKVFGKQSPCMCDTRHSLRFRHFQELEEQTPLILVHRMYIRHFRHFRQSPCSWKGQRPRLPKKPFASSREKAYEVSTHELFLPLFDPNLIQGHIGLPLCEVTRISTSLMGSFGKGSLQTNFCNFPRNFCNFPQNFCTLS